MLSVASPASPKTSKELQNFLDLITNADEYKKRLNEFLDAQKAAEEATARLTKAKDLDAALKAAEQAKQAAQAELDNAKDHAKTLKAKAASDYKKLIDKAHAEAAQITGKCTVIQAQLNAKLETAEALHAEAQAAKAQADQQLQAIERQKVLSDSLLVELNDKKAKIEAAMKLI